jgi:hypothetical protein
MLGTERTCRAPGYSAWEAAQADYDSNYECSHNVDATGKAKYNGLIYARGATCTAPGEGRRSL